MPTQHAGGPGNIGASLRTTFSIGTLSGLTDGQLLERFAHGRGEMPESEAAFKALVERHGPMVLGVCRAVCATGTTRRTPVRPRSWSWRNEPD
jgi:hypothetical protein